MAEVGPTPKKTGRNRLDLLIIFLIILLMFVAIFGVFFLGARQRAKQEKFYGDVMRQRQEAWEKGESSNFKSIEKDTDNGSD
jgi:hypothetical protein